jgi:broad specificity phosphatase PhoE
VIKDKSIEPMKIILVRHGQPDFDFGVKVPAGDIPQLVSTYNAAPLSASPEPSPALMELTAGCNFVVCSDLVRSTESARRLGAEEIHISDPLFRELDLPHFAVPILRLTPYTWFLLFRVLWLLGLSANGESLKRAQRRAGAAAQRLEGLARRHGTVLFVGHGVLNRLIARELLATRWSGPGSTGTAHWDFDIYTCEG